MLPAPSNSAARTAALESQKPVRARPEVVDPLVVAVVPPAAELDPPVLDEPLELEVDELPGVVVEVVVTEDGDDVLVVDETSVPICC
jgi:hypothetical protein